VNIKIGLKEKLEKLGPHFLVKVVTSFKIKYLIP